jgi:hypothetical protein
MGGHSDPAVTQPISTDQALAEKLRQILDVLRDCLVGDFKRLFGVSLPNQVLLRVDDYDLISTQTNVGTIVAEYGTAAASLVRTKVADPNLQATALAVVQGVLDFAQKQGSVGVGGYAASELVHSGGAWVSAVLCEVDFGNHQDWGTPVDFLIIKFALLVWSPPAAQLGEDPTRFKLAACYWPPTLRRGSR